jgi:hypothetical protein
MNLKGIGDGVALAGVTCWEAAGMALDGDPAGPEHADKTRMDTPSADALEAKKYVLK